MHGSWIHTHMPAQIKRQKDKQTNGKANIDLDTATDMEYV